ncbi:hypothetical protein LTR22_020759 [Elasticomyces elasticus]|nr:hypothetical protein LTR22_020759 [Elasticomyces elasticus]KAK5762282.1 hypothetical protein LTS12_007625 [Elasticomyces elasticus]
MAATLNIQPSTDGDDYDSMEGIIYYGRGEGAEHTDSDTPESQFLRLPREIRDEIYIYITKHYVLLHGLPIRSGDVRVLSGKLRSTPWTVIFDTAQTNLLCVSHQIHDEYVDYIQPRSTARVVVFACARPHLEGFEMAAKVPLAVLKKIKTVTLEVNCLGVLDPIFTRTWTNRKAEGLISVNWNGPQLKTYVHPEARVQILIDINSLPDLSEPLTWQSWLPSTSTITESQQARILSQAFHIDTIFDLASDTTLSWPLAGNLKVYGKLRVPLWCSMATNSAEVVASRRAWEDDWGVLQRPQYEESWEYVVATMVPSDDVNNWKGFTVVVQRQYCPPREDPEETTEESETGGNQAL